MFYFLCNIYMENFSLDDGKWSKWHLDVLLHSNTLPKDKMVNGGTSACHWKAFNSDTIYNVKKHFCG